MRNVRDKLRLALVLSVFMGLGVGYAAVMNAQPGADPVWSAALGIGAAGLAILVIVDLMFFKLARATIRARRADQRIAAWQVSPADWADFVAYDDRRATETNDYVHSYKPRRAVPASGVEVLASRGGILIDGVFLPLSPRGLGTLKGLQWLAGPPECIEFAITVPRATSAGSLKTVNGLFRVPIAAIERDSAAAAFVFYRDLIDSGELADPGGHQLLVRLCWVVAVIGLPLGALGFWMNANGVMHDTDVPLYLALLGTLIGGGAATIAAIVWFVMLRK